MPIMFDDSNITAVKDLLGFLATAELFGVMSLSSGKKRAEWIEERLHRFKYRRLSRKEKNILRRYLCKVTGCKERTIKYHITAYKQGKKICRPYKRNKFALKYTNADKELLAETDNLHSRLNASATKKICEAMFKGGDVRYTNLSKISPAHIYNLRKSGVYKDNSLTLSKTQSVSRPIGERKKPEPNGIPGYIRIDTVHQGDKDGEKGVYHINLVDEVLQWEVVASVEGISEAFLLDVLEISLKAYPYIIKNFHSDNGSEFINHQVSALLNKLLITQTKSRPRRSNDNGLVETKNGSIIRKHIGHLHIPRKFASRINKFYQDHLIPYLNFHRPCAFPKKTLLSNGKIKISYLPQDYKTPLQKFLSLKYPEQYLRPGMTIEKLKHQASLKTPNQSAMDMQKEKRKLFSVITSLPSDILSSHSQSIHPSGQSSN